MADYELKGQLTETIVLNQVISPEAEGGQIHLNVVTVLCCKKIKLTQKQDLFEQKYFTGSMPLITPTTVLRHAAVLWPYHLPQFVRNVVQKLA